MPQTSGGLLATRLQLSDTPRAIGIEIQNWKTRFAVAGTRGTLIETATARTPATPEQTVELIAGFGASREDYIAKDYELQAQGQGGAVRPPEMFRINR